MLDFLAISSFLPLANARCNRFQKCVIHRTDSICLISTKVPKTLLDTRQQTLGDTIAQPRLLNYGVLPDHRQKLSLAPR